MNYLPMLTVSTKRQHLQSDSKLTILTILYFVLNTDTSTAAKEQDSSRSNRQFTKNNIIITAVCSAIGIILIVVLLSVLLIILVCYQSVLAQSCHECVIYNHMQAMKQRSRSFNVEQDGTNEKKN